MLMVGVVLASCSQAQSPAQESGEALRQEEHQRILGVLPNFNTTSEQDAARLSSQQKLHLAIKTALDPVTFGVAALDASFSQLQDSFHGYGQGKTGYGKRLGASYADSFNSTLIGNAFLPILFKQDPRYFRKGGGTVTERFFYAVSTTVRARSDSGRWVPNYANCWETLQPAVFQTSTTPPLTAVRR